MRLRHEDGASAVEFALIAPLLFMLLFGIIGFGLAFLRVQSIRTAVREGGRTAAVGAPVATTQQTTVSASSGYIPSDQVGRVAVSSSLAGRCTANNIGDDVTVTYDTSNLPEGGVIVRIPLLPDIVMTPVITASFRCEV
jgi:Flp pilus assembly protein TadG